MLISIVIPMHNESANIMFLQQALAPIISNASYTWEIICINDGSRDDTLQHLLSLHQTDNRYKIIDLSRNFGKEAALTAGITYAKGDAVIPFDADLQDPPECIMSLLQKWQEGYEVVNAVRQKRSGESWLKKATAHLFYRCINKLSLVSIAEDTGDFRLLSRKAVDALLKLPERRRFMKGLFSWLGFRTATIHFERAQRHAGTSKWNYWKLWNFAIEGITSFSQVPLQLSVYVGAFVACISFLYGLYFLIKTLLIGNPVHGYPSLIITILFMGGVQLMALGIIGEYLGRVYEEVKQRPLYLVRETWL